MADTFKYPFEKNGFNYSPESIAALSEYEKYELSFHPERPKYLDYLSIFEKVEPCFISDEFGTCLLQTHRAELEGIPVMLVGQQTGPSSEYHELKQALANPDEIHRWNHGMPVPASYRRAVKAIQLAEEESRIIIIFVDTPGADPTERSEANGIAWRIGDTIHALADVNVPTISVIINRACSGGAIALTGTDVTLALEHSTYLVITPEACSSILFHTRSRANEAAEISQITSREGYTHGIVDELIRFGKVRRGWLGVSVQEMNSQLYRHFKLDRKKGVLVVRVVDKSPADVAGLMRSDVILAIGGHEVTGKTDFQGRMASYTVDNKVRFSVLRNGKIKEVEVKVISIPKQYVAEFTREWLGLQVQQNSPGFARKNRLGTSKGMVVMNVVPKSAGDRIGISPGDVIRQVNQDRIDTEEDYNKSIAGLSNPDRILLLVQRGRQGYYVTLEP